MYSSIWDMIMLNLKTDSCKLDIINNKSADNKDNKSADQ